MLNSASVSVLTLQSCTTEKEGKGTGTEKGEDDNSNLMKEWQAARDVLSKFDDRLHDLRKVGFSFITGLLALEALLLPTGSGTGLPNLVKLAILVVTLTLIVAVHLVDHLYRIIEEGAAIRASIVEKPLNLELTDVISFKYNYSRAQRYVGGIYVLFIVAVLMLGWAILSPDYIWIVILGVGAFIALVLVYLIGRSRYYPHGLVDWRIDRLVCRRGEIVGIDLTNLDSPEKEPALFLKGTIMWAIMREGDRLVKKQDRRNAIYIKEADQDISIDGQDSYTWLWEIPKDIGEGIYRVHRTTVKPIKPSKLQKGYAKGRELLFKPLKPLKRKLRVIGKQPV